MTWLENHVVLGFNHLVLAHAVKTLGKGAGKGSWHVLNDDNWNIQTWQLGNDVLQGNRAASGRTDGYQVMRLAGNLEIGGYTLGSAKAELNGGSWTTLIY